MAQLTIYLDEKTQAKARRAAKRAGRSLSGWAREQLSAAADGGEHWPEGFWKLSGSIEDDSFEEPEELDAGTDTAREPL
jgi:plasmid stability protein